MQATVASPEIETQNDDGITVDVSSLVQADAIALIRAEGGLPGVEAHVLRNVVNESGETGLPLPTLPCFADEQNSWYDGLQRLIERGLVRVYCLPTPIGERVNELLKTVGPDALSVK